MLKKLLTGAVLAGFAAAPVIANPPADRPLKPTVERGTSDGSDCFYFDATGATEPNACTYHLVIQTDAAGKIKNFQYHDQGYLNPDQVKPDQAMFFDYTAEVAPGVICAGREVLTPDGRAYSDCQLVR